MTAQHELRAQLRAAALVVIVLAAVGALLGLIWQAWSPPGPFGLILDNGVQPDETEAWAAADGRFGVIVALMGLVAGVGAWLLRSVRGPYLVAALAGGGIAGAAVTDWVGHLVRGSAKTFACFPASGQAECTEHLPLTLHMPGLLYVQPALAILIYGLLAAFATRDDLGRPDPLRANRSVPAGSEPDDRWSDRDGAGVPEQGEFSPQ